jgi:hypothetical protein
MTLYFSSGMANIPVASILLFVLFSVFKIILILLTYSLNSISHFCFLYYGFLLHPNTYVVSCLLISSVSFAIVFPMCCFL